MKSPALALGEDLGDPAPKILQMRRQPIPVEMTMERMNQGIA
jgi:hypothetical protein